jgi:uncharacterized membrane protein
MKVEVPDAGQQSAWVRWSTVGLSIIGLGLSVYLTVAHYAATVTLTCSASGVVNCEKVTQSPESVIFGVIPVAVLGLAYFVAMTALCSPWAWRARLPAVRWLSGAGAVAGIGMVIYLVYTELFTLDAICIYCTAVHAVTFLLFCVLAFAAAAGPPIAADQTPRPRSRARPSATR